MEADRAWRTPKNDGDVPVWARAVQCRDTSVACQHFMYALIGGCAVVYDQQACTSTFVGRDQNIDRVCECVPLPEENMAWTLVMKELWRWAWYDPDNDVEFEYRRSTRYLAQRASRVNLLMVQHRVVEDFPSLRIWREHGQQPGQEEVWLHRHHGGLHLGGVVWVPQYYRSGQIFRDLGLDVPWWVV